MTDVGAVPADAGQQLTIYFGGSFDQSVMGAPVYFWFIFLMGCALFCVIMYSAYHRYFILDKIWGYVECYKKKIPMGLIRTRYRKAYLKPLDYVAQVFSDEDTTDKWYAPALETSSNLGGVDLIEAVDYYDWLQDPILNEAIKEIVYKWDEKNPDDKIRDPIRFQKFLSEGRFVDLFEGVEVKTTTIEKGKIPLPAIFFVDLAKVEQYLPRTRSSAMLGGYANKVASDLGNKDKVDWKSYVIPVAVLCTCMIICGIIAGMLATGKL
jgi:hypothetical protein